MIVDSSAVIAILRKEPERQQFAEALRTDPQPKISAATLLECCIVAGAEREEDVDYFLDRTNCAVVSFNARQVGFARAAHQKYGRGSGSKARLNFGDCFSYALAKDTDEPLLFKGEDFTHTDIAPAWTPER